MSEAPKKIWFDPRYQEVGLSQIDKQDIPYIRADIVDELVEALKAVVRYAGNSGDDYLADQIRAALAKLEESHD